MAFQIFTDTSSGMPKSLREKYNIDYFRMGIVVDGKEYMGDLDFVDYSREEMYGWVRDPKITIRTSLVTAQEIESKLTPYLEKGIDILYIACSGALSGTRNAFELFKEEFKKSNPNLSKQDFNKNSKEIWKQMCSSLKNIYFKNTENDNIPKKEV